MNILQPLDMERYGPIICTLNPTFPLKEETIQARVRYEHPILDVNVGVKLRVVCCVLIDHC